MDKVDLVEYFFTHFVVDENYDINQRHKSISKHLACRLLKFDVKAIGTLDTPYEPVKHSDILNSKSVIRLANAPLNKER